ncbi:hypothetical protein KSD_92720 [Ktedonobacter sp. SOSP1-85]|nr:hypothetical protein KSD_92720 [Ktedonobacter sp. SOSP1-85]
MHTHIPWSVRVIRVCRARLQLAAGDLSAVEQWAQEQDQAFSSPTPEQKEASLLLFQQEEALLLELLSEQEQGVLRLLIVGRSNPEIARELVISVNTVETHIQGLYRKLNVHNRIEASEVARRLAFL